MDLEAFQQCRSLVGWTPVAVASTTERDRVYTVFVNPYGDPRGNVCECKGFTFRRYCKHQHMGLRQLCGWEEIGLRAEDQSATQRKEMVCPRCEGGTMWSFKQK